MSPFITSWRKTVGEVEFLSAIESDEPLVGWKFQSLRFFVWKFPNPLPQDSRFQRAKGSIEIRRHTSCICGPLSHPQPCEVVFHDLRWATEATEETSVALEVVGKKIRVNRQEVARKSGYFRSVFFGQFMEKYMYASYSTKRRDIAVVSAFPSVSNRAFSVETYGRLLLHVPSNFEDGR